MLLDQIDYYRVKFNFLINFIIQNLKNKDYQKYKIKSIIQLSIDIYIFKSQF